MSTHTIVNPLKLDVEIIGLVGLAHGISHFFQLFLPTLFPWLIPEYGLSFTQVGLLTTLCFAVSAIGQAPGGFVVDAWGPHRVLMAAISLFIVAAVLVVYASGFGVLGLAAVLVGLGNSVFHPADFTLLNRCVSTGRLGHAFSVHGLTGNLGWALAPAVLATVATFAGWRSAAWVGAFVAVLPWVILILRRKVLIIQPLAEELAASDDQGGTQNAGNQTLEKSSVENKEKQGMLGEQLNFLQNSGVWMSFCFFLIVSVAFGGMQNFAPSVFISLYDLPAKVSAWLLSIFLIGGSFGMLAGGFLVARGNSNDKTIALVLGIAALCLFLLASGNLSTPFCVLFMFIAGCATGIAGPARDMLVRQSAIKKFGTKALGRVYGLVYSGLDVGIALSPLIFGSLLDFELAAVVLVSVAGFYIAGGGIALKMGRMNKLETDRGL